MEGFDSVLDELLSMGSPISRSLSSPDHSTATTADAAWRLTNPVHMELQENARLPTFNISVDRSGSAAPVCQQSGQRLPQHHSSTRHPPPSVRGIFYSNSSTTSLSSPTGLNAQQSSAPTSPRVKAAASQQLPSSAAVPSLAEAFLNSSHRRSYHATWEAAGALKDENLTSSNAVHKNSMDWEEPQSSPRTGAGLDNLPSVSATMDVDEAPDPLDMLAAEVDPTPLSEIKLKHQQAKLSPPNGISMTTNSTSTSAAAMKSPYSFYPYYSGGGTRPYPLPIPTAPPLPATTIQPLSKGTANDRQTSHGSNSSHGPGNEHNHSTDYSNDTAPPMLADAVATAAALASTASVSPTVNHALAPTPPVSMPIPGKNTTTAGPYTTAQQQSVGSQQQYPHHHYHHHQNQAAALAASNSSTTGAPRRATPPASIERASQQQAQYGFGKQHMVPSVPTPPGATQKKGNTREQGAKGSKTISLSGSATGAFHKPFASTGGGTGTNSSNSSNAPSPSHGANSALQQNSGAAYERKKQRAKDARIKLNESIERLSIAINLAGTQSKQRLTQWERHLPHSAHRQAGLKIIQDCMQTSESAKKWDRPSFVGSAASLIQGLNAQCEALMRELMSYREQCKLSATPVIGGGTYAGGGDDSNSLNGSSPNKRRVVTAESLLELPADCKRPKLGSCAYSVSADGGHSATFSSTSNGISSDEVTNGDAVLLNGAGSTPSLPSAIAESSLQDGSFFSQAKISMRLAALLDNASLVRCSHVSKGWRRLFARDETWQDRALHRFGYYNVRQWSGKYEDEDGQLLCSPLTLFKHMDIGNVMPHFNHDGMFLLGEARLPGKVSAWTFLVERSNGETLRTCKRPPSVSGKGVYTSLPIVELKTVVQNTGIYEETVVLREQLQTVDASTRRRGEEMKEVTWDGEWIRTGSTTTIIRIK